MKATGIVRKIDELGRIVIPKEIRKTLKVKEGMPLEIYTDHEGGIVLRKYLPFSEMTALSGEYAECMARQTGAAVFITDREKVIAVAGTSAKNFLGTRISRSLERVLDDRDERLPVSERRRFIPVTEGMEETGEAYSLIRSGGEVMGAVILLMKDVRKRAGELERKVTSVAAEFLGKQVDI